MEEGRSEADLGVSAVCGDCLTEVGIRKFIAQNATERFCTYCGRKSTEKIGVELDDLLEVINRGIFREYESPDDSVPYDSAEGGYQYPTVDSWDILDEVDVYVENDDLRRDLRAGLVNELWVPRDPYAMRGHEELAYAWRRFCEQVMHETRFV